MTKEQKIQKIIAFLSNQKSLKSATIAQYNDLWIKGLLTHEEATKEAYKSSLYSNVLYKYEMFCTTGNNAIITAAYKDIQKFNSI